VSPALDKRGAGSVLAAASLAVEEVQKVRVLSQMEVVRRFGCAAAADETVSALHQALDETGCVPVKTVFLSTIWYIFSSVVLISL